MADTSVVVAAFASWHESHDAARRSVAGGLRMLSHVALESYSVLTRLPPPFRMSPAPVADYLRASFNDAWLQLPAAQTAELLAQVSDLGVRGGAVYDGLIGATAAAHGATLLSLDSRARRTYEHLGVAVEVPT